ncbi:PKD domain-containing protein [candidate division WOR-3 bacterium]|nr:PKD domain-containing protein [candidate division WOR-3 bacterium]
MNKIVLISIGGWLFLSMLTCASVIPVSVNSVAITPLGSTTQTALTAEIEAEGEGIIKVDWFNAAYDTVSLVFSDEIDVDGGGTYSSVFDSGLGWYWIDVYDENDSLLWHTDSVFCGSDSSIPEVSFKAEPTEGSAPLTVKFSIDTDSYTSALWDFGDGATSTDWEPEHIYQNPGEYTVKLTVTKLAGSRKDSTVVSVGESASISSVGITPPGDTTRTTLTATIQVEGKGNLEVQWHNAAYDTVSLAWTDAIEVSSSGSYESVFESEVGWYWVDIYNEVDSLLWHTDRVFCGPDILPPEAVFFPNWEYGPHPLDVTFFNETDYEAYSSAFWDFGDGATSTDWEPDHTFESAGQFNVVLTVYYITGTSQDSSVIFVW